MNENQSDQVSKKKLKQEFIDVEDAIENLEERVNDLEDKDMMAELETISLEDELNEIEEMLNHMDQEELEKRLKMVEQIKEEYQEGKVHEKLEYLYQQIKEMREEGVKAQKVDTTNLDERLEELESKIDESNSGMPEKYKKAVRSNYNEIKEIKKKIEDTDGRETSLDIKELERRIDELESLKSQLDEENLVFVEERTDSESSELNTQKILEELKGELEEVVRNVNEGKNLSNEKTSLESSDVAFDIKSIKKRIEELEGKVSQGGNSELDLKSLRTRLSTLENRVENTKEFEVLKNDLEKKVESKASYEDLEDRISSINSKIEMETEEVERKLRNDIESIKQRTQKVEDFVGEEFLENIQSNEEEISEKVDNLTEVILDNQGYIDQLEQRLEKLENSSASKGNWDRGNEVAKVLKSLDTRMRRIEEEDLEEKVSLIEDKEGELDEEVKREFRDIQRQFKRETERVSEVVDKLEIEEDSDRSDRTLEKIERKIDNLSDHVISNQEKIHRLQQKISSQGEKSDRGSGSDVTIIS